MSKKTVWFIGVVAFVLPSSAYFVVNGYWWLFDGNVLIPDKMAASFLISMCGSMLAAVVAEANDIFREK